MEILRILITCLDIGLLMMVVESIEIPSRLKRDTNCSPKFRRLPDHSACRPKSNQILTSGVSKPDKELILNLHNKLRGQVKPTASNMAKLVWDDEAALIAQSWADNCDYNHDKNYQRMIPDRFTLGQNLALGYGSWENAINAWFNEYKDFKYGVVGNNFKAVGHYTQMVWATTTSVGCGYADCKNNVKRFYVCNYGPSGNVGDLSKPYKEGSPAADCPKHKSQNLCACNKVCESRAGLRLTDCTCKCGYPKFQKGDLCKIDCKLAKTEQPHYGCEKLMEADSNTCLKYANVPYMCPITCDVCSDSYTKPTTQISTTGKNPDSYTKPTTQISITGKNPENISSRKHAIHIWFLMATTALVSVIIT